MVKVARNLVGLCLWTIVGWNASAAPPVDPVAGEAPPARPVARAEGDPDSWCPSGRDLDAYLEARRRLPWHRQTRDRDVPPPPVVSFQDGVLLIEDAGAILHDDRVFDLPMESIELIPAGNGFQVFPIPAAYEPALGSPLFANQDRWRSQQFNLTAFAFPFGGVARSQLWITSTNLVAFEPPTEPVKVGLCSVGCFFDQGQVLLDRLPRISPLQHGSFLYGWNAFVREESDRLVVTWQYGNPANLDVQAVLFADGRIRFNYRAVSGILHGAVVAVTGNDGFWSDLRLGGDVDDPVGDVPIPPPDGPGMDIVAAAARQVGTSELLQIELTLAAPPPSESEAERIFYQIELRDHPSDTEPLGSLLLQWQRGQFYWMTEPATLDGSTLRMNLRLNDLPLEDDDLFLAFRTFRGDLPYEQGDLVELRAVFEPTADSVMLDLTADLPATVESAPVYEAFTMPSLEPGDVLEVVAPLFEDPSAIEAFAIYQNLWTDIYFFAGAYHAGGNAGADGIGFGSSATPRSPSLLHLNNVYNYTSDEWATVVLNHEFGHRWLYHFAIEEDGAPSRILNPAGSHPAGWVHTPAAWPVWRPLDYSLMGGSNWKDNGDGTFRSPPEVDGGSNGFSWHEMYLLGLAAPGEVTDWWYIRDPAPPLPNAYWAPHDTTVSGERVPVTVDQIIAVEGPRHPAYPDSPQSFLTPVVLVVRPGEFLPEDIDAANSLCGLWESTFPMATGSRGALRCRFTPPVVTLTAPTSDVVVSAGDSVVFEGQAVDDDGDLVELRWSFAGAAPDATGPGPHPVTFTTTGAYDVRLEGVDETGMLAVSAETVQVTVECPTSPPSGEILDLTLAREAGGIRFTWTDLAGEPVDYVVLGSDSPEQPFTPRGTAVSGSTGLLLAEPQGDAYYEVAARNAQGCLGPY